ncbi:MAG: 3-hydroxyacyl-CoA dehydrogenase family protein, partial [Armatimonadetes bacterium]|nr:3-hydroxyacyl-CoA dehydrogenase family protein [Armatimonadota bacterium]
MAGRQIAVIGAGLMGSNIALDFARAGFSVTQTDTSVEQQNRCTSVQAAAAAMLHTAGLSPDPPEVVLSRITPCRGLADTVCEADLVIEAISEDLERKQRLFEQLAFYSPSDAVLASNTSSFMPSELAGWTGRAERVLVTHYFNPAHLIPLVELVPGPETDPRVIEELKTLYRDLGKHPVVVRREVPGFIGNRLQFALLREALALVESGVASPEDVDTV